MQFRILGPAEIYDDVRQRRVRLNSPKQRMLLGALVTRLGTPVPTDQLVRELWGNYAPDKAVNALQAHVSRLRQVLIEVEPSRANAPRLIARGAGYLLQVRPDEIDSAQFRMEVTQARRFAANDPRTAYTLLQKALKLWRGPAMDGGSSGPLCAGAAARLEEERLLAMEDLYDAALRLGVERQVVGQLEELVVAHPGRERFRRQLTVALGRVGRRGEQPVGHDRDRRREAREQDRTPVSLMVAKVNQLPVVAGAFTSPGRAEGPQPSADDAASALEVFRLRLQVEQLMSEQSMLRMAIERLTARAGGLEHDRDATAGSTG
ncbi:putative regulatory protein [Actinacidiphila reveromycinica]|uniref:Putative regulatory protein n=1 Tax=Actinacidiphila reveromycinica TaxID=659352 RepID=A0A7U3UWY4_9ACTN|nr:AfsR/SARP family transcriptional regulator [Streptomyces sp. SN-593]BBB00114.1 putative regulatory protein [Streptomyces sp. SN-593]